MDEQIAEMRRIWSGEPVFEGADQVGPRPVQAGGPPFLIGAMGPKSIARASHWADGIYAFSMGGNADEIARIFSLADEAWKTAGSSEDPYKMAGFWYSLLPCSEPALKESFFQYQRSFGDEPARSVADTMTRHTPEAVREAIGAIEAIGCDEIMFSAATAEELEIEQLSKLIS